MPRTAAAITVQDGADYWIQFVYTDGNGNAVAVTSPKMEVRATAVSTGTSMYTSEGSTPTITITQPTTNTVKCTISGATTKNKTAAEFGYWDCYAVDPNGAPVCLGVGSFTSTPNVTVL